MIKHVFTTVYWDPKSGPLYWQAHLQRLKISCRFVFSQELDINKLSHDCFAMASSSSLNLLGERLRVRILSRSLWNFDWEKVNINHCGIEDYFGGVRNVIKAGFSSFKHYRSSEIPSYIKLPYFDAYKAEAKENLKESCYVERGIIEGHTTNIIAYNKSNFYIPPLSYGMYHGIMLEEFLQYAKKNGIHVHQKVISKNFLIDCDEVILTNALHGIRVLDPKLKRSYFL